MVKSKVDDLESKRTVSRPFTLKLAEIFGKFELTEFIMNFQNIETHFGGIFEDWNIVEIRNFLAVDIFEV